MVWSFPIWKPRGEGQGRLTDMARDALFRSEHRQLAVEVRDERERQLIRASLWFDVRVLPSLA
jgi:hypothetical protein